MQNTRKFVFVMNHTPTTEQAAKATELGQVVELQEKKLLTVPDDAGLARSGSPLAQRQLSPPWAASLREMLCM